MNYQQMQQERIEKKLLYKVKNIHERSRKLKELANEQAKYLFAEYMVKNGLGKNPIAEAVSRAVRDMK